jgi:hypothetical protein
VRTENKKRNRKTAKTKENEKAKHPAHPSLVAQKSDEGGSHPHVRDLSVPSVTFCSKPSTASLFNTGLCALRASAVKPRPSGSVSAFYAVSPLGTPYSALSWLARGLQPFGINSRVMRIGTQCAKGYDLADFTDAFARFLNP